MKLTAKGRIYADAAAEDINRFFENTGHGYDIIIFEDDISGNYVQSVCGSADGVIEARIYKGSGYKHYRGECSSDKRGDENIRPLVTPAFTMNVPEKQIMDSSLINEIIMNFFEGRDFFGLCQWSEISI
ncbi:MAG: hypothetical protein NC078_05660 [Ruminococcus sp.]|nr:hypothetical protein [Ruminococcus sp.]